MALAPVVLILAAQTFCGIDMSRTASLNPQLQPRDEASRRPDFVAFRTELLEAVARKDESAILSIVDPGVRIDFGGGGGLEDFKKLMKDPRQHFWEEFGWVLAHGGTFRIAPDFSAPYVFSTWPDSYDPFDCSAVTATRVRLREAPRATARVLAHLDFAIVQPFPNEPEIPGWTHVKLASGEVGYISSTYLRSSVDYRAIFSFERGRWWLVSFVAGD